MGGFIGCHPHNPPRRRRRTRRSIDALSLLFGATQRIGGCKKICSIVSSFFAYLDDTHVLTHRVGDVYKSVDENLWGLCPHRHPRRQDECVECNDRPEFCDTLEVIDRRSNPEARVRRRSDLPFEKQGIKILGTPLGHPQFVEAHFNR